MIEQHNLFGYSIASDSVDGITAYLLQLRKEKCFHRVVTLNPEMVVQAEKNKFLKHWLRKASVVVADGQGIVMANKLLYSTSIQLVTGIDLALHILRQKKVSIYLLGGTEAVLSTVKASFSSRYPASTLLGSHHGYFSPHERSHIIKDIVKKKPDFIFVCMGFPQQEYMIQSLSHYCSKGVAIGLGGVLDVLSGEVTLAPLWIRILKCEWLYRTIQRPKRLERWPFLFRYIVFVLQKMMV
jgi:N-acetylglucosaminyldiphosphoundecaprenol N-acetyl-beta-D-mannosaminyltransferase